MNNTIRTLLGGLILGLMATALYVVLPGNETILKVAYVAVLVALVLAVLITLALVGDRARLPQDFVFSMEVWRYLGTHLLLSTLVVGLDIGHIWSAPWPLFSTAHFLLLGFFALRIVTMSAGKEAIDRVEEAVAVKVTDWRLLLVDLDAIKNSLPRSLPNREQAVKELQTVCEALRYSDPMSKPSLAEVDAALKAEVAALGVAVDAGGAHDISALCTKLLQRLKDRNNRVKALK